MLGLLIFFFLTWHQTSKGQFKKNQNGKEIRRENMHPTVEFNTVHCGQFPDAYAPKWSKTMNLSLMALVNRGDSLRLEAVPE